MFLTRLGFGSKIVVTGDVTQVDLPGGAHSGLRVVREILDGVEDVHFAKLTSADVVRHRLVGDIVDAYERWDAARQPRPAATGRTARTTGPAAPAGELSRHAHRDRQRVRIAVDEAELAASAGYALDEMGVNPLAELSVLCVDVDYMAAERALDGRAGADRRARLPDGRAGHRPARRRRPGPGAARRRRALPGVAAARRAPPATRWTTSCTC